MDQAIIKAWGSVPGPAHAVYRALCELEERKQWDKNASDLTLIDNMDSNTSIYYSLLPVTPNHQVTQWPIVLLCRGFSGCNLETLWICGTSRCCQMAST